MDVLQAGLILMAFALVRLMIPVVALLLLSTWANRRYERWDFR